MSADRGTPTLKVDLALLGCGLANGLIAMMLREHLPELSFVVVEAKEDLPSSQTWSLHESDLVLSGLEHQLPLLRRMTSARWQGYEIDFPAYKRSFKGDYLAVRGEDFSRLIKETLGSRLLLGEKVLGCEAGYVYTSNSRVIEACLIIDGRGWSPRGSVHAYQKFVGQMIRLKKPHGLEKPRLMDVSCEQIDGFRFIYTLPFEKDVLLVEDTRYSNNPNIQEDQYVAAIQEYCHRNAWQIAEIIDTEKGALPIPLHSSYQPPTATGKLVYSGMAAGIFHPVTGYSIAHAFRFADFCLKQLAKAKSEWDIDSLRNYAKAHWQSGRFYRRLNNMLFLAAQPEERYVILQKFYTRNAAMIARFYAQQMKPLDYLRVVSGKPPVPLGLGMKAFFRRLGGNYAGEPVRVLQSAKS